MLSISAAWTLSSWLKVSAVCSQEDAPFSRVLNARQHQRDLSFRASLGLFSSEMVLVIGVVLAVPPFIKWTLCESQKFKCIHLQVQFDSVGCSWS